MPSSRLGEHASLVRGCVSALTIDRSALVWKASTAKDNNDPLTTYYASLAKLLASEHAISNANMAVQIFGGSGYNEEYPVAKLYRDSRIFTVYEGELAVDDVVPMISY